MRADDVRHHLVRPGDTYYSLARIYGVSVDALIAANAEYAGNLVCGTTIVIPDSTTVAGNTANAASGVAAAVSAHISKSEAVGTSSSSTLRVALVLPLRLNGTADKQQARQVELYQGFLMALDSIQSAYHRRFDLTVYDSADGLTSLLGGEDLANADLIISTVEKAEAQQLAAFAEQRSIPLVLPFVYDAAWHSRYPHTYQINTPKAQTYDILTEEVLDRFADFTPVFVVDSADINKSDDYTVRLRSELSKRHRIYHTFGYSDPADLEQLAQILPAGTKALYVPVTAGRAAMRRMFPYLQYLRQQSAGEGAFAVLGTPEWQLYTDEFMEFYYSLDVYLYSKIYVNPFAEDVQAFYSAFKRWYGCDPMPLYPKYALVGYDLGLYFLTALTRTGRQFGAGVGTAAVTPLQSAITLRSEGNGYINRGVYLIHFTPQTTIEKYDLR
jgi:murein DD-endopeptidase MepM/ murein hydrolase activator NlpD